MSDVISVNFKQESTSVTPILVSRNQARAMLGGISISHLRRLMQVGELRPVFLNASPKRQRSGKLYFRTADLEALVEKYAKRAAK